MKTLIIILIFIFSFSSVAFSYERDKDEWGGSDKPLHVGASFLLETAGYNFYRKNTELGDSEAKLGAFLSTLIIGFAKEFIDDKFSWKDIGADVVGAGIGVGLSLEF